MPNEFMIKKVSKKVLSTCFPACEFVKGDYIDYVAREQFALRYHSDFGAKTIGELCKMIAYEWLKYNYCRLCRSYDKLIIEHQHIKGNAGRYRGVLCARCNQLERYCKDKEGYDKVLYLEKKLRNNVDYIFSRQHIMEFVSEWYL